jgi:site-specific DNA recombinase
LQLGYRAGVLAGILDINPETADIVKRIYEEYVTGASPRAIAAGLNGDSIPAPRGGKWNASTINCNTARGQGLLLNERFVGRVVWNKRKSVKDPRTGRRVTRINAESEWIVQNVPELRILDDVLFNAARERRLNAGTPASRRQPKSKRLLSGLLRCGTCGSGMAMTGCDRSGPRIRCSRNRESGSCSNSAKYYIDKIERLVLDRLKNQIDNPKLMGQFIEAYLAERRALSATARRDKVKITAQIETSQRSIERLVTAVENGTLEAEEIVSRLQTQRSEKARLQRELESADALVMSVDLHPTAIKRFKQNLEQISGAKGRIDAQVAASFRELIDSVVVMARKPGEPYRLETRGPLSGLIGGPGGAVRADKAVSAKLVVPVERIELPTFGLQNGGSRLLSS